MAILRAPQRRKPARLTSIYSALGVFGHRKRCHAPSSLHMLRLRLIRLMGAARRERMRAVRRRNRTRRSPYRRARLRRS